jgi:hypothetical protein
VLQARAGDAGAVIIHPSIPRVDESLSLIATGTVHGAIRSGRRAAAQLLRHLGAH